MRLYGVSIFIFIINNVLYCGSDPSQRLCTLLFRSLIPHYIQISCHKTSATAFSSAGSDRMLIHSDAQMFACELYSQMYCIVACPTGVLVLDMLLDAIQWWLHHQLQLAPLLSSAGGEPIIKCPPFDRKFCLHIKHFIVVCWTGWLVHHII